MDVTFPRRTKIHAGFVS